MLNRHPQIERFDPLLALRGIAILIVLVWHSFGTRVAFGWRNYTFLYILPSSGYLGIWIFLCLSGYLMGKIFFNGRYETNFWGIAKFYYNRVIRIVPLYLLVIITSTIVIYKHIPADRNVLFSLLTFTANDFLKLHQYNAHLWAISLLMQFYFVFPFLYLITQFLIRKRVPVFFLIFITMISGFFIRYYYYHRFAYFSYDLVSYIHFIYTPLITNLDIFIFSFMLSFLIDKLKKNNWLIIFNRYLSVILLVFLYLICNYYTYKAADNYMANAAMLILFLPALTYILVGYFVISVELIRFGDLHPEMIGNNKISTIGNFLLYIVTWLGKISFGVYLWHWSVMDFFKLQTNNMDTLPISLYKAVFTIGISTILAIISYYVIERPFAKIRFSKNTRLIT